ncbi:sigma-54-dependent Fis family transcriptional regulator [bacterium]|nr:sigma-54-dependent Fis family transcriptional regulator [candidate division CSSED10-310 bacterium]
MITESEIAEFSDIIEIYPFKCFIERAINYASSMLDRNDIYLYISSEHKVFHKLDKNAALTEHHIIIPEMPFKSFPEIISISEFRGFKQIVVTGTDSVVCYPICLDIRLYGLMIIPDARSASTEKTKKIKRFTNVISYYLQRHIIEKTLQKSGRSTIIMGTHPSLFNLQDKLERLSILTEPVLIQGESGSGKEIWGEAIHALSLRADQPFIAVNCSAVPSQNILHDHFFGHRRGAFTGAVYTTKGIFELADHGTVFLDEIGDIGYELQTLLLRVVENGIIQRIGDESLKRVDIRVLSATHQDLQHLVSNHEFRLDLYHRIAVFNLNIPSLKERISDIEHLSEYLLYRFADSNHIPVKRCSAESLKILKTHSWPGNVRELENVLKRAALEAEGPVIGKKHIIFKELPMEVRITDRPEQIYRSIVDGRQTFWTAIRDPFIRRSITKDEVKAVMAKGYSETGNNLVKLSKLFGMSTIEYRRLVAFLHRHGFR